MNYVPEPLQHRLGAEVSELVDAAVEEVVGALRETYARDCRDHDPSIGDNRYTFGQNVYHHGWYAIRGRLHDPRVGVSIDAHPLCWRIDVGRVAIRVYKMGSYAPTNIHAIKLEPTSAIKEQLGTRNEGFVQLELDLKYVTPRSSEDVARFAARELVIGHFGNPDTGLLAVFFGAPRKVMQDGSYWAWVVRIDQDAAKGESGLVPEDRPGPTVPYSGRGVPEIDLELYGDREQADDHET